MRRILAAAVLSCIPGVAHANWLEASSTHFVVYGDTSESNLRRFSEQLERYDRAMALALNDTRPAPSPSNRVTIYIVSSDDAVRALMGKDSRYVQGFYTARAGGSLAVVPPVQSARAGSKEIDFSTVTLLHEYAHHFLTSNSTYPMPRWMSEGAAEFFSSANFETDGAVGLGRPAYHRAMELNNALDVKAKDLLDPEQYEKRRGKSTTYDAFYGKSWLLYHYLTFNPERKGQLQSYMTALAAGKPMPEAGQAAFGDFVQLEKELDRYLESRKMSYFKIPAARIASGPVNLRPLSAGERAIMPVLIRSKVGVDKETAPGVLAAASEIAARFPDDPAVLAELAEAQVDAGKFDEAIATANRAIQLDPKRLNAHLQKGHALLAKAADSGLPADFLAARKAYLALNAIENDHPLPLLMFYRSFLQQGIKPTANAVQALERAAELAPHDDGLRMTLAMQYLRDGKREWARAHLTPLANSPHGGGLAAQARQVLERMEQDRNWDGSGLAKETDNDDGQSS